MTTSPNPNLAYQDRLLEIAQQLSQLSSAVLQLAADAPGGRTLDVPGSKPLPKPKQRALFQ